MKNKLRLVLTLEYEPDINDYPEDSTLEQMAEIDRSNISSLSDLWDAFDGEDFDVVIHPIMNSDV